jgi:hypothetical protein
MLGLALGVRLVVDFPRGVVGRRLRPALLIVMIMLGVLGRHVFGSFTLTLPAR